MAYTPGFDKYMQKNRQVADLAQSAIMPRAAIPNYLDAARKQAGVGSGFSLDLATAKATLKGPQDWGGTGDSGGSDRAGYAKSLGKIPYGNLFVGAGKKYGLDPKFLAAVAKAESNFNPRAGSSAGAQGIMQFMPATAAGMGVNPHDPRSAIYGAARLLKSNWKKFGSRNLALAAYNAGPGAVQKYGGVPPYAETRNYIAKINKYMAGSVAAMWSG